MKLIKKFLCKALSITLASRLENDEINLVNNSKKISSLTLQAKNTFTDQQKW